MKQITIKHGKDPKLKIPTFLCDKALKEDVPSPYNLLVNGYKVILWVGRPSSGKTSHLISLFRDKRCLKKVWNHIILVAPQASMNSLKQSHNIFKDIDDSKRFTDLSRIDLIREMVKHHSEENESSCIIIDDMMSDLKVPHIERVLVDLCSNRRHYKCHIIILSQIYERVPLRIRKLLNTVIMMFRPSKKDMSMMMDELLEENEETAQQISKITFEKPYDWLLIDVPSQQIFSKYNQLIIDEK